MPRSRIPIAVLLVAALLTRAGAAAADAPASTQSMPVAREPRATPPAVAAATAVVPGVVIHGTGHLVGGRTRTGLQLLALEGLGIGLAAGGLLAVRATGASRRVVTPLTYVTLAGASLFFLTLAADLYGTIAPDDTRGEPLRKLPWVETRFGLRAIHDPFFQHGLLVDEGLDYRRGALRVSPSATFAAGNPNRRLRVETAYRFTGPTDGRASRDGSYAEVEGALTDHAFARQGFDRTTGELSIRGRIDLQRMARDLRGSFAEGSLGLGLASIHYRSGATETDQILLGRFGYGFYLGGPSRPRGEVTAFYDHRRDGYFGGMKVPGIGAGFLGSVGAVGRWYLDKRWGVQVETQAGSAIAGGASILFREGAVR